MFSGMTMSGLVPLANRYTNARYANTALTVTPAMRMIIFLTILAVMKLSGARNDGSLGFSPLSLTNQPSGIRLSVYSVPDLSCRSFLSLGGIPTPIPILWHAKFGSREVPEFVDDDEEHKYRYTDDDAEHVYGSI
jgi:hypothetical protein